MTVSLCMICGNEEAIIEACLQSAAGAFDELCLVRAVGSTAPDDTVKKAGAWCAVNGKDFRFSEYFNAQDMPHVDHFGDARQMSFNLATSDWCLWLDCDDYLEEIDARRIREASETCTVAALSAVYRVAKQGGEIHRERLIRRGKGRWRGAIHETFTVTGETLLCQHITIYHRDHKAKDASSSERNLRILRAQSEDVGRTLFYLGHELHSSGNHTEAVKVLKCSLELLRSDQPEERYAALLDLAVSDPQNKDAHLLAAAATQPHRREAMAYLAQNALDDGRVSDGTSWFRMMDSLPVPSPVPWTHQSLWYGWARNILLVRLLRARGQTREADEAHARYMTNEEYAQRYSEFSQ